MAVKTFLFFCFCRGGSPQACGPDLVQLRSACGVLAECLSAAIRIIKFEHWLEPGKDRDSFTYHAYVFLSLS